jgi:hypothetical protein
MTSVLLAVPRAPLRWFRNIIRLREKRATPFAATLSLICFVSFARAELELLSTRTGAGLASSFVNNIAFYVQATYLYALLASKLAGRDPSRVIGVVMIGIFLGIFPPIVDILIGDFGHGHYHYVASGFSAWSWSLFNPRHYSSGEAIVLWASVLLLPAYVAEVTRSLPRTLAALGGSYAVTTFIALVPSTFVDRALVSSRPFEASRFWFATLTCTQLVVAQAAYLACRPGMARRLLPRLLHASPFVALTLLGSALANWLAPAGFSFVERARFAAVAGLAIFQLCVIALVQNDAFDAAEDVDRPTGAPSREDAHFFTALGMVFVLAILIASPPLGTPLALFLIGSTVYSYDFYRAKRYFPANYKIEGLWASSAFVLGGAAPYLVLAQPKPSPGFAFASFLVFGGWFCFNGFKDYKDIRADYYAGNQTLYVLAFKRGFALSRLHRLLRAAFALSLFAPPVLLAASGLPVLPLAVTGLSAASIGLVILGRPPKGATVRAFLWLVTAYVTALACVVESFQ